MKRKSSIIFLLALCTVLTMSGCRKRIEKTESETQSETLSETEKQSETQAQTQKQTNKPTPPIKKPETETTKSTEKKTVKPSTVAGNSSVNNQSESNASQNFGTKQCPYCFQQISTAPSGNGSTIYAEHVAQEKAWADAYGWGDNPPANTPSTEAPTPSTDAPTTEAPNDNSAPNNDVAQCGYCYQWFTVSDGSYAQHIAAHNADLDLPSDTEYIQCPKCGYSYPKGNMYDNHVCVTE